MKLLDRFLQNSNFLFHKPSVIKRVLNNYIKKIIYNKNALRTVDICLDYHCNFKCSHCYAADFNDDRKSYLSLDEIYRVIDQCSDEGALHFNIIGGEPTLNANLFELCDYIDRKPALISLATNGSMITLEYAQKLKKHNIDVILLSLDSTKKDAQDAFRGPNFYANAIEALKHCLNAKLKVYISTVLTKENIKDGTIKNLSDFCEKHKLLLHVNLPALMGNWKKRDDLFLDKIDQEEIKALYKNKYIRSCEMSTYFSPACRTGIEKLHITAYGDVMPCTFIPISFGNIKNESLKTIRKRIFAHPLINASNELCIPATNKKYHHFMTKKLKTSHNLPISYKDIKDLTP